MKFVIFIIGGILIVILSHLVLRYGFKRRLERFSQKLRKELPWLVSCVLIYVWIIVCACIFINSDASLVVMGVVCGFLWTMNTIQRIKEDLQRTEEEGEKERGEEPQ